MAHHPQSHDERLLRLLALKRHEVPPPGFFEALPGRVLVNIRAGTELPEFSWWERLWNRVLEEPMLAGSYAALGVGVMLFGTSVFQMAVEPESPAPVALHGMVHGAPGLQYAADPGFAPDPALRAGWVAYPAYPIDGPAPIRMNAVLRMDSSVDGASLPPPRR